MPCSIRKKHLIANFLIAIADTFGVNIFSPYDANHKRAKNEKTIIGEIASQ